MIKSVILFEWSAEKKLLDYLIFLFYLLVMNQIEWDKKAIRQFRKIKTPSDRAKIHTAIKTLTTFPNCQNVKKLVNRNDYRLRVGNWRVVFTAALKIIRTEEVKKRDETTY